MTERKAILLIMDGLSDRPVSDLGDKTPLEYAQTPAMDAAAARGVCGLMDPIAPGCVAGSDTAHLALLGLNPYEIYSGRGPFEAAGIDMEVQPGDVAFRVNFSTVDDDLRVVDRRAGRITEGTHELAQALNGLEIDGVKCYFKESVAHRAALVLRGEGLGANVSDVDPHEVGAKIWEAKGADEASQRTAEVVNKFVRKSHEILREHPVNKKRQAEGKLPANIALPRGAGLAPHIGQSFDERFGLKSACIVETGLIRGIGVYLKMDIIDVEGATGGLDSDVMATAKAVVQALDDHNFVLCNIKGPDVAGHDQDAMAKVQMIERIDQAVRYITDNVPSDTYLVLTADHSTPIEVGDHSGDPVPLVIDGPGVRVDEVTQFNERAVTAGGLLRVRGTDLMLMLTNLMGVQHKFGA